MTPLVLHNNRANRLVLSSSDPWICAGIRVQLRGATIVSQVITMLNGCEKCVVQRSSVGYGNEFV
jgi:hypothetical protein